MKGGRTTVKYYPIKEVLNGGILNALGIKLDQKSIENYDKLLHNPVALKQMESGIENLTNVVIAPVVNNAIGQMVEPLSKGIHKIEDNVLNEAVSAIPVVGQGIEMGKYALGTGSAALETANELTNIAKDSIEQIQEKAAELNPLNQINNQIESAQNAVANNIKEKISIPIPIPQSNALIQRGGAILSRIQNSVKDFTSINKNKTAKNVKSNNMKGGLNQKKNKSLKNLIIQKSLNQKGGKILSRIQQSIKEFTSSKR